MIVFVGQVGSDMVDREAFQEIDYRQMFGSVAKWAAQIDRAERIPEYVAHAYRVAHVGPAGAGRARVARGHADLDAPHAPMRRGSRRWPARRRRRSVRTCARAARPARRRRWCIVGGSRWDRAACAAARSASRKRTRCRSPPRSATRTCSTTAHPHYAGDVGIGINPKLAARVRDADVLLVIGERLGEMTTSGYTLLEVPVAAAATRFTCIRRPTSSAASTSRTIAIAATPGEFLAAMNALPRARSARSGAKRRRRPHAEFDAWRAPRPVPGDVDLWQIVQWLDERLPDDAILTNGAGNYTVWLHRLFRYRGFRTQLAPYSGAMGYGVPAAVAAKAVHPAAHGDLLERRRLLP